MKLNEDTRDENKMGTMPINKLLIRMSLPMILSMVVQALYNVVDSIFVANINENALTAVSLSYPIQHLIIAFGTGVGVGVNALLAKSLGEKNHKITSKIVGAGLFITIITYVIFAIIGIFFVRTFFQLQTQNQEIMDFGTEYLTICCLFSFGALGQFIFEKMLQSTGKTLHSMFTQAIGAVINLVLDPILIFGYFSFPRLGVAGAAYATVIGQIAAAGLAIYFNIKFNKEVPIDVKEIRPNKERIKRIYSVGIGSITMMALSSVLNFSMNTILIGFTATAAAVFGIYFKIQSFVTMPLFGLNNGMVPILSYNFGAREPERMKETIKLSIQYAIRFMILCTVIFIVLPGQLIRIFNASEYMLAIGEPALRIIGIGLVFSGISIICSSIFQALDKGGYSMAISIMRQLVPVLPLAWAFSFTGNLNAVWCAIPLSEIIAFIVCLFMLKAVFHNVIHPISKLGDDNKLDKSIAEMAHKINAS